MKSTENSSAVWKEYDAWFKAYGLKFFPNGNFYCIYDESFSIEAVFDLRKQELVYLSPSAGLQKAVA